MKFCPNCEVRLKKSNQGLTCPKCGYIEGEPQVNKEEILEPIKEEVSEFNVFDENEGSETLPTINIDCEKCGNKEAVWWMLQTRSADEPTTQFYRCTKCKHTWRNYA